MEEKAFEPRNFFAGLLEFAGETQLLDTPFLHEAFVESVDLPEKPRAYHLFVVPLDSQEPVTPSAAVFQSFEDLQENATAELARILKHICGDTGYAKVWTPNWRTTLGRLDYWYSCKHGKDAYQPLTYMAYDFCDLFFGGSLPALQSERRNLTLRKIVWLLSGNRGPMGTSDLVTAINKLLT
jgi:hypothetical protein